MPLSNELFVMFVFCIGFPIFWGVIRSSGLPGSLFFLLTFFFLVISNICTIFDEGWVGATFMDDMEHICIAASAITLLVAVLKLTGQNHHDEDHAG